MVYGARIRAPHALVMTLLFRSGSLRDKVTGVLKATWEHSKNLGIYVGIYKAILCLLRNVMNKNALWHHAMAGAIGGVTVFGKETPVNTQINLYVASRVVLGAAKYFNDKGFITAPSWTYQAFAAIIWAAVMVLFEETPSSLQKSLKQSMHYLYHESNSWPKMGSNLLEWFLQSE